MNELSLFSGAGGGLLATKHFLNWRTIGYVESNNYCQQVLAQRIKDGVLDEAPIFTDIRAFIDEGYADAYKGMVGVISAGFPCQPFSVAGEKKAQDDARNMWPQTLDVVCRVRPRYCLLENVPGLLSRKHRYFETILKDLAESRYNAKWKVISAAEMGAPHKRDRLFIMAHSNSKGLEGQRQVPIGTEEKLSNTGDSRWWSTEPDVGRVAHGVASRVDRLKALGNGQVPRVVETAWEILTEGLDK